LLASESLTALRYFLRFAASLVLKSFGVPVLLLNKPVVVPPVPLSFSHVNIFLGELLSPLSLKASFLPPSHIDAIWSILIVPAIDGDEGNIPSSSEMRFTFTSLVVALRYIWVT